tara:strand:+ start:2204 stop:3301 length:1098 start_codon:yes stop_codon:yes gene_type:complete
MIKRLIVSVLFRLGVFSRFTSEAKEQWRRDLNAEQAKIREREGRLHAELKTVRQGLMALTRRIDKFELVTARRTESLELAIGLLSRANAEDHDRAEQLTALLDRDVTHAHIMRILATTPVETEPMPHMIVENLLPADLYELLIDTLPSSELFGDTTNKLNLKPELLGKAWRFMERELARRILTPALVEKFSSHIEPFYRELYGVTAAAEVVDMPQEGSGDRLLVRGRGYHIDPHQDVKRAFLTCLIYFAKPGDSEEWGTQLFRVVGTSSHPTGGEKSNRIYLGRTSYPEKEGLECEPVTTALFKANSALFFVNSDSGAHGVDIPEDARPANLERYAYQFYIGPPLDLLKQAARQEGRRRDRNDSA